MFQGTKYYNILRLKTNKQTKTACDLGGGGLGGLRSIRKVSRAERQVERMGMQESRITEKGSPRESGSKERH